MFDRRAIMARAWQIMHAENTFDGRFIFGADGHRDFGRCLRQAWHEARAAAGRLLPAETALDERTAAIRAEIEALRYKSGRYDVAGMQTRLQTEVLRLTA
jgi:hypothetical protein